MRRIASKLLCYIITTSIQGINPNNQSIWLGHVRSWWILTIQQPSYARSDHFPRIFALLCSEKTLLCSKKTLLCSEKTPLCSEILHCAVGRLYCALRRLYCALRRLHCALARFHCAVRRLLVSGKKLCRVCIFPQWPFFLRKMPKAVCAFSCRFFLTNAND